MNGIINLKKEAGMTSHDAVFKLRKILGTKKIGHGGTLDPDVVGVCRLRLARRHAWSSLCRTRVRVYEGGDYSGLFHDD